MREAVVGPREGKCLFFVFVFLSANGMFLSDGGGKGAVVHMWSGRVLSMKNSEAPLLSPHSSFLVNVSVNDGHSCSSFMGLEYSSLLTPLTFSLLPCPPSALF